MLTKERLKDILHYDMVSGIFTRLISTNGRVKAGDIAGTIMKDGYIRISVDSKQYLGHRLAWLYVYGEFPEKEIDHINTIRTDNRICNLRAANRTLNAENIISSQKNNKSGFLGVNARKYGTYRARIRVNKKLISLGSFLSPELAHQAYLTAKRKLHNGCTI